MGSPKRSPKRSPPRRALHERSESQKNTILSPTSHLSESSDERIYSSNPFPSQPSHFLSPRGGQGLVYEDEEDDVSYHYPTSGTSAKPKFIASPKADSLVKKGKRPARSVNASETDLPVIPPLFSTTSSTARPSQATTSKYSLDSEGNLDVGFGKPTEKVRKTSSAKPHAEEESTTIDSEEPPSVTLASQSSLASLASSASSDTLKGRVHKDRNSSRTSVSYSAFPPAVRRPGSARASSATVQPLKPVAKRSVTGESPLSASPSRPQSEGQRSISVPSAPSHTDLQAAIKNEPRLQYPVVRAPSASGSWANTSIAVPQRASRMESRGAPQWITHLSTISSDSERMSAKDRISGNGSSMVVEQGSERSVNYVLRPPPLRTREIPPASTIRMVEESDEYVDEYDDSVSSLQYPPLRQQTSGFLSITSQDSRRNSFGGTQTRPSSRGSVFTSNIPAWARYIPQQPHIQAKTSSGTRQTTNAVERTYYSRGNWSRGHLASSNGAPGSSTEGTDSRTQSLARSMSPSMDGFSLSIFRPRNRPHNPPTRDQEMEIRPVTAEESVIVRGPPRGRISIPLWSPRLQHDKRSTARQSVWKAPSLDEKYEGKFFSRRNTQVLMFCLGFLLPFAWIIAACLPLPPHPTTGSTAAGTTALPDLEEAMTRVDEARYQNARWWRNLNRIMAVLGIVILAAIIALAIVAARA
ncbi:MAG: hypothetical protein M1827_005717 [Pycnora praestabilis]|nr:MAG: hypothetical protein M1827_005717 [Pycnora praestabilis]